MVPLLRSCWPPSVSAGTKHGGQGAEEASRSASRHGHERLAQGRQRLPWSGMKNWKLAAQLIYDPQHFYGDGTGLVLYVPEQWVGEGELARKTPIRLSEQQLIDMAKEADVPEEVRRKLEALVAHAKKTEEVWSDALEAFQMYVDVRGGKMHVDEELGHVVFDFSQSEVLK